jgi:hypothetical protein
MEQSHPRADHQPDPQRLSFTLSAELYRQLRLYATRTDRSSAAVVRLALRKLLLDQARR